jgi:hypothetical protein
VHFLGAGEQPVGDLEGGAGRDRLGGRGDVGLVDVGAAVGEQPRGLLALWLGTSATSQYLSVKPSQPPTLRCVTDVRSSL